MDKTPKVITQIDFGVFSGQEAKQLSVIELHHRDLYDVSKQVRTPMPFGALDRRMGTSEKTTDCETCGESQQDCVGHFGVVRLALPVFHIGYFKLMVTLLQNICKTCSRVLVDESTRRKYLKRLRNPSLDGVRKREILKSLNLLCKKAATCMYCGGTNGTIKKVGALKLVHEKFRKKKPDQEEADFKSSFNKAVELDPYLKTFVTRAQEDLNPLVVEKLLQNISAEDCELLGLDPSQSRPQQFLWTAFPVPPTCIRPSVGQEASSVEDDLTVLASDIVDINAKIRQCIEDGSQATVLVEYWDFLQLQCAMYITSELPGIPNHLQQSLQKIKKGVCQRLKGKHGRFRGNLSGKRVDFSARTVISPDPNLRIDEVAVPELVAKVLTYPERVNKFNIERLKQNIKNGPDVHPGATYLTSADGKVKKYLKYGDRAEVAKNVKLGDVVDRHIHDGDIVLFNRQPSLHKLSIMSHFVKVRPWRTFRFNECVCTPYNADFDGDEMNLHVPQTEEARAEAMILMGTKNNLVTPRNGEPLIAATQDFITASYLISRKDIFYTRAQFMQILCYFMDPSEKIDMPPPSIIKPHLLWTGKQVFSVLLRPSQDCDVIVNLDAKCRTFGKDVKDRNGVAFGQSKTRAGHSTDNSMDPNDGFVTIRNSELLSGVIDKAIIGDGNKKSMFYVVIRDYGPVEAATRMNRVAKLAARWLANHGFSIGIDDVMPGERLRAEKDATVAKGYADCESVIEMSKRGALVNAPGCDQEKTLESKLSGILSKIRDDVGQVCFQELNKYNAPLIMSLCGSKGSKINVSQMVACVGQQIISGERVPDGFGDRSLPHFPKNSKTPAAKGFVGNSFFSGLTPTEFLFHAVSGREGLVDTAVKTAETGYMQRRLMKALEDLVCHYDYSVRDSYGGMVQFSYGDDLLDPANIEGDTQPVEFTRNLMHVQTILPNSGKDKLATPDAARETIKKAFTDKRKQTDQDRALYSESFTSAVQDFVAGILKSREGSRNQLTEKQLKKFLEICVRKYLRAKIEPGTAVGAIGAQSIGEPGTQMTLKTFHFAGVASMNVTLGVPRIKEIINAAKKISTPLITAPLKPEVGSYTDKISKMAAEASSRVVKGRIEKTLLKDILKSIEEEVNGGMPVLHLRIDLEAIAKLQLELDIHDIVEAITTAPKLKMDAARISATKNRISITVAKSKKDEGTDVYFFMQALKRVLPKIRVKGLDTVIRSVINEKPSEKRFELLVEGNGLLQVMGADGIDGLKTTSNHVLEVLKTLGIEAARQTIINEIIYTMKSHGMTIDQRHVMLLADLMSFKGEILGITRFGIAKMKDSVLMLASFEKTTDHLFEAAFYGKHDKIQGVSECIIMGVPMSIGTGLFKLVQTTRPKELTRRSQLLFDI
ncbi:hypothetical protein EDD86DRAFT_203319 [Gorgonomyces haynaldii]|nr:hypothetical protein EDD86DRAFT_203319 [Gorgonomyces haynaldii]